MNRHININIQNDEQKNTHLTHLHTYTHTPNNKNRTSTIPPVSAAAVHWAQAHGQITDEWLRLHLVPAAFEVNG